MRYILGIITVFIVALVAFAGWIRGPELSMVDAEFAPLAIAEVVFEDGTTANLIVGGVERTTTAEEIVASILDNTLQPTAGLGSFSVAKPERHQHEFWSYPETKLREDNRYMTSYGLGARKAIISYTMRYLA